jgi:hypothetical protein
MHATLIDGLSEIKSLDRLLKCDQFKLVKHNKGISATMNFFKRLTFKESIKSVELFHFEKSFLPHSKWNNIIEKCKFNLL